MKLSIFNELDFLPSLRAFFKELQVPINAVTDSSIDARDILTSTYRDRESFNLIDEVYFLGMVDDGTFRGKGAIDLASVQDFTKDYEGIVIFGVTLKGREGGLLPTRSQLAEISRAFNREFCYTPVVVVFKYAGADGEYLAFANTERSKFKRNQEGEKAGKVTLLRDVDIRQPHSGHERILANLAISNTGKNKVDSFASLYKYWQEVLSVSLLNKKFYQDLSNWYFWAVGRVTFPSEPNLLEAQAKKVSLEDLKQEHKSKNVIRLLTRLLFVWFIKEKGLIPPELFELDDLQRDILKNISLHTDLGLFKQVNQESIYYKAILQNLFFATLNCPIKPMESNDNRVRGFRKMDNSGQHRDANFLMRYREDFQNPERFVEMVNGVVPFLNGGLFECLDDKLNKVFIDGFSDNLPKTEQLIVPDYLFFGAEEKVDLSAEYGATNKGTKEAAVKGLINILKAYKFTITENTPIEEDVALDPELLGKVFENLLASYNPETKTTARKQTGSFYTPREIVNYMVDESLIAYLKNELLAQELGYQEEDLDRRLRQLVSFDDFNPFKGNAEVQKRIIKALDKCTILDPACGSGAFPMGILQKMVHILFKVDPNNMEWEQRQIARVDAAIQELEKLEDAQYRDQGIQDLEAQKKDIREAFNKNDLNYGRKLYLIENCIYGVDIQSIATQISKLRFFISLVVDQRVDPSKDNFGIRPLPNLETKFVAANTLIGIEKTEGQLNLFDNSNPEIEKLEADLKKVRHRLFSSKSPSHKRKLREQDKVLREQIAVVLQKNGWTTDSANKLANWDPYNLNDSSPFFDPKWMFDISDGFNIVIGNPPYLRIQGILSFSEKFIKYVKTNYISATGRFDLYCLFTEKAFNLTKESGIVSYIMPFKWTNSSFGKGLREFISNKNSLKKLISFSEYQVFTASTYTSLLWLENKNQSGFEYVELHEDLNSEKELNIWLSELNKSDFTKISSHLGSEVWQLVENKFKFVFDHINTFKLTLKDVSSGVFQGIVTGDNKVFILQRSSSSELLSNCYSESLECEVSIENTILHPVLGGREISRYKKIDSNSIILYPYKEVNSRTVLIPEKELQEKYPLAYEYLKRQFDRLNSRGSESMKYPSWYSLWNPRNFERMNCTNKILTPDVCYYPQMWLDRNDKCFHLDTSYAIIAKDEYLIYTHQLYSILNSSLVWFYLKNTGAVLRGGYFRFKSSYLENFPLPELNHLDSINGISYQLNGIIENLRFNDSSLYSVFEMVNDALVFQLYFSDHMKEKEIDVLQFIQRDIEEVMQGKVFENLDDTAKEKVIEQLYAKWTDPDNEVRDRIKLFAVRSPDILKPILESK